MPSSPALGAPISEHRCGRTVLVVAFLGGPLLLLIGPGLVAALFLFPEPDRPLGATITLAAVGVGACALGVLVLVFGRRKQHTRVLLYEGGIVETVRNERRELPWTSIASFKYVTIYSGAYVVTQLTIVPKDGPRWRLNSQHVLGLDAIANRLAGEVTDLSLPSMRARLAAGERVEFGKLALSSQGIHKKRRLMPWSEVAGVWVHAGYLRVLRHGDPVSAVVVNGAQLERMDALLALIRENCRRAPVRAPFAISDGLRRLVPKLVAQTLFVALLSALFFGFAFYNLWRAFRLVGATTNNLYSLTAPLLGWALLSGAIGVFLVAIHDVSRHFRRHRLARRLAKDGKLVPVMVLDNKFEDWGLQSRWRYRYLTPRGVEAVDRIDVGFGGAAIWAKQPGYLLALCSIDERESVLITLSGYPLAQLPATPIPSEIPRI